jgi:hypothetical protein
MKVDPIATHASAVLMGLAWLAISSLLFVHFETGLLANTTLGWTWLGMLVLSWLLIPVQVVRYYRRKP